VWLTTIYGWVAAAVVIVYAAIIVYKVFRRVIPSFFKNTYKVSYLLWTTDTLYLNSTSISCFPSFQPDGDCQHIDFSSDPDCFAYVPQIKTKGFAFPFLACAIDTIDHASIGWGDEDHGYNDNNLIFDVPRPERSGNGLGAESEPLLSDIDEV
jgi:hypothetical protein